VTERETLRLLIARLGWPVRMVRWRVAQEYGALFSNSALRQDACDVFVDWLSTRQFESEVVSALAVLFCCSKDDRPDYERIRDGIRRPSVLSELILSSLYGKRDTRDSWLSGHSGPAPSTYRAKEYFLKYKGAHVPPIIENNINRLESKTGFPFFRQWAFEWECLTETTNSPYSGSPYHFVKSPDSRSGVNGQFSQRQCDVYRSAYLRTFSFAADAWGLPSNVAGPWALESLPMNLGLANLTPVERPMSVAHLLGELNENLDEIEQCAREFVRQRFPGPTSQIVSAKVPVPRDIAEFGEISISAALVSADFTVDQSEHHSSSLIDRGSPWVLSDGLTFGGDMPSENLGENSTKGKSGVAAPVCLDYWPMPSGFWHSDYFQTGIALPASYAIKEPGVVNCYSDHIALESQSGAVAKWVVWHDQWTPLYPKDGRTRCGMMTCIDPNQIVVGDDSAEKMLGWFVNFRTWDRERDFDELELTAKSAFFFDEGASG